MKNLMKVTLMLIVIGATMLTVCGAAFADYGFSPTYKGYGFEQAQSNIEGNNGADQGTTNGARPSSGVLRVDLWGYIDYADGYPGSWNANVTGGSGIYSYEWNLQGVGIISTANTAHYNFSTSGRGGRGTLTVTVWDSAGNSTRDSRLIVVKTASGNYPAPGQWGF